VAPGSGPGAGWDPPRAAPIGTAPWWNPPNRSGSGWDSFFTADPGSGRRPQQPMSGADLARAVTDAFRRSLRGDR
jgi:hypothetical protein